MGRADMLCELGLSPVWVLRQNTVKPAADDSTATAPPPPREKTVQRMDWTILQQTAEQCALCGLQKTRRKVVFGVGDRQAPVMFIGEGPGAEEDKQGEPFVGRAGKLLDMMLHAIALNRRQDAYIANIIKCRPPDNRNPTPEEARACLPYLQRQIALVKPRLLVALGKIAASHLLQTETSISQLRQKIHDYDGIPLIVTYHPAYLLRSPLEKRKSWDDLRFARKLLQSG